MKALIRPQKGRWIAGVCAGIAQALDIPVIWVRLFWIFLLFPGGLPGFIPYLVLWMLIPSEKKTTLKRIS